MADPRAPWPGPREVATAIRASLELLVPRGDAVDPSPEPRILAQTISESFNTVILFAAPRLYGRWSDASVEDLQALRDATLALLDKLESVLPRGTQPPVQIPFSISAHAVSTLRDALGAWSGTFPPPADVQRAAEGFLASSGVPAPPGGWAAFDHG